MTPRRRTRRTGSVLLALFSFLLVTDHLVGEQDDPSEIFLKAYLSAQQGAKLERENHFKTALAKYRFAGSLIGELRKSHADWQPGIVEYRGRKISEGILRIQDKLSTQDDLTTSASRVPEEVPAVPETEGWPEPGPEALMPRATETSSSGTAIKEATKNLRSKVNQLQDALKKSRSDLETAQKEK